MARLMIVGGRIVAVSRDVEEDSEQYWDRAWAFARAMDRISGRDKAAAAAAWSDSLKRHHEKRGVLYPRAAPAPPGSLDQ